MLNKFIIIIQISIFEICYSSICAINECLNASSICVPLDCGNNDVIAKYQSDERCVSGPIPSTGIIKCC
jgi:hypothetical protein